MSKQNELLKELVAVRIKRVLARSAGNTTVYERNFYNQVGRGVTPEEFAEVLDKLVADRVVIRTPGQKPGTNILTLSETQTDVEQIA